MLLDFCSLDTKAIEAGLCIWCRCCRDYTRAPARSDAGYDCDIRTSLPEEMRHTPFVTCNHKWNTPGKIPACRVTLRLNIVLIVYCKELQYARPCGLYNGCH